MCQTHSDPSIRSRKKSPRSPKWLRDLLTKDQAIEFDQKTVHMGQYGELFFIVRTE